MGSISCINEVSGEKESKLNKGMDRCEPFNTISLLVYIFQSVSIVVRANRANRANTGISILRGVKDSSLIFPMSRKASHKPINIFGGPIQFNNTVSHAFLSNKNSFSQSGSRARNSWCLNNLSPVPLQLVIQSARKLTFDIPGDPPTFE